MSGSTRPNVLIVMVDSLRPDRLGCGGLARARTPNLDRLASSGAFLRECFCPMPSSVPSRASILTGRWPHSHGLRTNKHSLPGSEILLQEVLSQEGYRCVATPRLDPGLERGFSHLELLGEPASRAGSSSEELSYHTTLVTDAAERSLDGLIGEEPWFLWVDYESTHEPWFPPDPYRSMFIDQAPAQPASLKMHEPEAGEERIAELQAMYDGEVALVDKNIGRLMDRLSSISGPQDTIVVLLSDHGVFLGEHGFFKKPPFLLDPLIRCTFMVSYPGTIPKGSAPATLAHICDTMPTVLGLAGMDSPRGAQGTDLTPVLTQNLELDDRAVFVEFCEYRGTAVKCVRTRDWKLIYNRSMGHIPWSHDYSPGEVYDRVGFRREMLFNLGEDPTESENVAESHPAIASDMKSMLIDWLTDTENASLEKE